MKKIILRNGIKFPNPIPFIIPGLPSKPRKSRPRKGEEGGRDGGREGGREGRVE